MTQYTGPRMTGGVGSVGSTGGFRGRGGTSSVLPPSTLAGWVRAAFGASDPGLRIGELDRYNRMQSEIIRGMAAQDARRTAGQRGIGPSNLTTALQYELMAPQLANLAAQQYQARAEAYDPRSAQLGELLRALQQWELDAQRQREAVAAPGGYQVVRPLEAVRPQQAQIQYGGGMAGGGGAPRATAPAALVGGNPNPFSPVPLGMSAFRVPGIMGGGADLSGGTMFNQLMQGLGYK